MKVYLAGPMRGIPYYNFPAFDKTSAVLRAAGHEVFSPADRDRDTGFDPAHLPPDSDWAVIPDGFDLKACIDEDLSAVRECEVLYLLDGWEKSIGAQAERSVAVWEQKIIVYETSPPRPALPRGSAERKSYPLHRGLFCYFPKALAAVAHHSWENNEKHNPGEPLHWAREKSKDHADCILRHIIDAAEADDPTKAWTAVAWRALARLELLLEESECHVSQRD